MSQYYQKLSKQEKQDWIEKINQITQTDFPIKTQQQLKEALPKLYRADVDRLIGKGRFKQGKSNSILQSRPFMKQISQYLSPLQYTRSVSGLSTRTKRATEQRIVPEIKKISVRRLKNPLELFKKLPELKNLQELDLSFDLLDPKRESFILTQQRIKTLSTFAKLKKLDIQNHLVGDKQKIAMLGNALKNSTNLEVLNLRNNGIEDNIRFFKNLKNLENLKVLDLSLNRINPKEVAGVLPFFPRLEVLNLEFNVIHEEGAEILSQSLSYLTRLKILNIGWAQITNNGALALASVLPALANLRELILDYNDIESTGAVAIANNISNLLKLEKIDISSNDIGTTGALAFASVLSHLPKLKIFNISNNPIGQEGKLALSNAMRDFKSDNGEYVRTN